MKAVLKFNFYTLCLFFCFLTKFLHRFYQSGSSDRLEMLEFAFASCMIDDQKISASKSNFCFLRNDLTEKFEIS